MRSKFVTEFGYWDTDEIDKLTREIYGSGKDCSWGDAKREAYRLARIDRDAHEVKSPIAIAS